jgi:putative ABC transport system permease protein
MKHQPPRLLRLLLQFYCNPRLLEELEGDLEELFQERVQTQGLGRARWRYAWDVFRCIRPYAWKRQPKPQPLRQSWVWLKHCLSIACEWAGAN